MIKQQSQCASSEDSDHYEHQSNWIKVFAMRSVNS